MPKQLKDIETTNGVPVTTTHNEQTLRKVYLGLAAAGIRSQRAIDAVTQMQNQGILFCEKTESWLMLLGFQIVRPVVILRQSTRTRSRDLNVAL